MKLLAFGAIYPRIAVSTATVQETVPDVEK